MKEKRKGGGVPLEPLDTEKTGPVEPVVPVWTWWGSILLFLGVMGLELVVTLAISLPWLLADPAPAYRIWGVPLLLAGSGLSRLVLLQGQRRRVGAKPLWDSRDLRDGRGWALAAGILLLCAAANVLRIVASPDPEVPALNRDVLNLIGQASAVPWGPLIVVGLGVVVLAPLTEEWLFRGILQSAIGSAIHPRWGVWIVLPFTSVVFGLLHGLDGWWVPAVYGFGIGILTNRQRSLALPMLVHGVINLTVFALLLQAGLSTNR